MRNLKEVILSITNRCNLRCKMCDIPGGKIRELSTGEWKTVIKDASRLGAQTIVFSGGEPLVREDIFDLVKWTRENNMSACITSNGYLLDDSKAAKLKDYGVTVVNISIEGAKETHESLRGNGSFDRAEQALRSLRKYGIESTVASTVSRYNYNDLPFIADFAKDCGATTVRLQPFNIIFLKDGKRFKEFLVDKSEAASLEEKIKKFSQLCKEYRISTNPYGYLSKITDYLCGEKLSPDSCGALWYSCPINPNGDVFPCWIEGARKRLLGNVTKVNLYELWLSKKRFKIISAINRKGCGGCLMSCYDEAFDSQLTKELLMDKAKKLRKITDYNKVKQKAGQFFKSISTNLKLRYKFYISYRGSLPGLFKRRLKSLWERREPQDSVLISKETVLTRINELKSRIKKEIRE